jgi:hypothetical protein
MDSLPQTFVNAQGGVASADQLTRLGLTTAGLRHAVTLGHLVRVRRAAYVDGEVWRAADADARYRLTVEAVMHSRSTPDVATHHSALALHGLPLWQVDRRLVMLSGDVEETTTSSGLRITPLRALAGVEEVRGLRTLPVTDAVVTAASRSVETAVIAGDAALHDGLCTLDEVHEAVERLRPGLRGRVRLSRAVAMLDPLAESPGESRTRILLTALGLPVRSQAVIHDRLGRFVARVDFLIDERVVLEFDGQSSMPGPKVARRWSPRSAARTS